MSQLMDIEWRLKGHKDLIEMQTPKDDKMWNWDKEERDRAFNLMAYQEGEHGLQMRIDDQIEKMQGILKRLEELK